MSEQFESLVELLEAKRRQFADRPALGTKRETGWEWTSYAELGAQVDALRAGLHALGVGEGDRVAIIANNRVEWAAAAYASYGLGAAFVPMYEAQLPSEWEFILHDSGAKVVFASKEAMVSALQAMRPRLPALEHVIGIERSADDPSSYLALLAKGRAAPVESKRPRGDVIAGLVYTSGTTGKPKGVLLSHANLTSNVAATMEVFPLSPDDRSLSFLPWAHVYGQVTELHMMLSQGGSTALNDDIANLVANLAEVKPTILVAVPRIFNKIYRGVNEQIAGKPAAVQALFRRALKSAAKRSSGEHLTPWDALTLSLADRLIFHKIRQKFGGRLKYAISASAALSLDVARFVDALGVEVYEGYGLTETSPVVSANWPGSRRLGSVGRVIPGVRVEIDPAAASEPGRGEIIVYGPNVMQGYYNRPEENAAALRADGGFCTGDVGYLDSDGYLWVTGRIKEQYKLENGKYVTPSPLEEQLKLSPYFLNVFLYGENRPYNVAVVVLGQDAVAAWAKQQGVVPSPGLSEDPKVRELVERELARLSAGFKGFERPRDFLLVLDDFTTENGMLTPTLKLKRRAVVQKYAGEIDQLYRQPSAAAVAESERSGVELGAH